MTIDPVYSQLILPLIVAIFLAINMGASGTAPSFSAAYGANLIPRSLIPGLFGIMVFDRSYRGRKKRSLYTWARHIATRKHDNRAHFDHSSVSSIVVVISQSFGRAAVNKSIHCICFGRHSHLF